MGYSAASVSIRARRWINGVHGWTDAEQGVGESDHSRLETKKMQRLWSTSAEGFTGFRRWMDFWEKTEHWKRVRTERHIHIPRTEQSVVSKVVEKCPSGGAEKERFRYMALCSFNYPEKYPAFILKNAQQFQRRVVSADTMSECLGVSVFIFLSFSDFPRVKIKERVKLSVLCPCRSQLRHPLMSYSSSSPLA